MPKIEVDEEQFLNDQKLRQTVSKLLANPEAALKIEEAYKLVDPNAVTPRLDARARAAEPVSEAMKKIGELEKQIADDKAERDRTAKTSALSAKVEEGLAHLKRDGWTKDGIEGVQKIMEEKGILDPIDAAAIYEKQHPPQAPVTPGGTGAWNFLEVPAAADADVHIKKMIENKGENEPVLNSMIAEALNEVRGQTPSRR